MGELKIKLPDNVEKVFRGGRLAMKKFGYQKGSMSEAATEAIGEWAEMHEGEKADNGQILDTFAGIMSHVKKGSVELQHEAWDSVKNKHIKKNNALI